jgi:hypothetical protein
MRRRASARRVLAWFTAFFFLFLAAGNVLLDHMPRSLRYPDLEALGAGLRALHEPPGIVFLGSSRTGAAYRAEVVERIVREETKNPGVAVANLALDGASPRIASLALAEAEALVRPPRLVVLEVSPENVSDVNPWISWEIDDCLKLSDLPPLAREIVVSHTLNRLVASRLAPFFRYRQRFRTWALRSWPGPLAAPPAGPGVHAVSAPPPQPLPPDAYRARIARKYRGYAVGGENVRALEDILARCRKAGAAVLLVAPPFSSVHRAAFPDEIEARFLAYVERLTLEPGVRFIDMRASLPDTALPDYHHTAYQDSLAFSERFARDVIVPAWSRARKP